MAGSNSILPPELQHLAVKQTSNRKAENELGQDDFLNLMLTQIKHQDPLNPMESGDFLSQMAQFGTVNGITELQKSFSSLATTMQSSQALQASTMVGNSVLVQGNTAELVDGGTVKAAIDLEQSTSNLMVSVVDAAGQTVRQIDLGSQAAGLTRVNWDGRNENGEAVAAGNYAIQASSNVNNQAVAQPVYVYAKVDSVTLSKDGGEPSLNLNGIGSVSISQVKEIL